MEYITHESLTIHPRPRVYASRLRAKRARLNWPGLIMLVLMALSTGAVCAWIYIIVSLMEAGQ